MKDKRYRRGISESLQQQHTKAPAGEQESIQIQSQEAEQGHGRLHRIKLLECGGGKYSLITALICFIKIKYKAANCTFLT